MQVVPVKSWESYGPGKEARLNAVGNPPELTIPIYDLNCGDFILTHRKTLLARLIIFGQRLRFHGNNKQYCFWNHAALVMDRTGNIVEALAKGTTNNHISEYKNVEYTVVRLDMADIDRVQIYKFGKWAVGKPYGFFTYLGLIPWALFGAKLSFGVNSQMICSGLVARALERSGEIFEVDPQNVPPAGLAQHFNVLIDSNTQKYG